MKFRFLRISLTNQLTRALALSLATKSLDLLAFTFLLYLTNNIAASAYIGTFLATSFNFFGNRHWVFASNSKISSSLLRYTLLAIIGANIDVQFVILLSKSGLRPSVAKLTSICLLSPIFYLISKFWIFRDGVQNLAKRME